MDGKVKNRTIANLSKYSDEEIGADPLALKHKTYLAFLKDVKDLLTIKQGTSIGAIWVLNKLV